MDRIRRSMILGGLAMALSPRLAAADTTIMGGRAFGSTWRLVAGSSSPARVTALITRRIAGIDEAMSPYRAQSQLSRFNRAAVGERVAIAPMMDQVVAAALETARATGGAFDPTTGPTVGRYGFGPITGQAGCMDAIDLEGGTIGKTAPGATLDLCGIAKGFALDRLTDDLLAAGATDFMLELGGELRGAGRHPSGRAWQIAIEDPFAPAVVARHIVAPGVLALATSGHRANGLFGDVTLSHVMDPHNARPATGFAGSVSVLAPTGMEADALATALLAMGRDGPAFARAHDIPALFVLGPPDAPADIMTGEFATYLLT